MYEQNSDQFGEIESYKWAIEQTNRWMNAFMILGSVLWKKSETRPSYAEGISKIVFKNCVFFNIALHWKKEVRLYSWYPLVGRITAWTMWMCVRLGIVKSRCDAMGSNQYQFAIVCATCICFPCVTFPTLVNLGVKNHVNKSLIKSSMLEDWGQNLASRITKCHKDCVWFGVLSCVPRLRRNDQFISEDGLHDQSFFIMVIYKL